MTIDTKFFTNETDDKLLERFKSALVHSRNFDVLAGYFRASGFSMLAQSLSGVEKIRILVGLNTDREIVEAAMAQNSLLSPPVHSHAEMHAEYSSAIQHEMEDAPETQETEDAISQFVKFLIEGRIEIRGHPSRNIHAKVYILHYKDDQATSGCVITGSSNFSYSGLTAQREFNVELRDPGDVEFASQRFEKLWNESVELTEEFKSTVHNKTWFNNEITPYELYLKFLYEYFKEDINIDEIDSAMLPEGFKELEYQQQAVVAAKKMLDIHNGVFLADVVGLGKTFISAMLLQNLTGRKLIICPPILKPYWEEALRWFYVHPFKVISSGKIADLPYTEISRYPIVLIDESHRYRNENTQSYDILKKICLGKKVILVSATPFNNRLKDLLAQIKLFQAGKKSTIPGVTNLDAFFNKKEKELKGLDPASDDFKKTSETIAGEVRDKILKHIMIRRTRSEVTKYFKNDVNKNSLNFPIIAPPVSLVYEFNSKLETAFQETIALLKLIKYVRYSPLLFLKEDISQIQRLSQSNMLNFIKTLLVKRLESSFFAFKKTVDRMIASYEIFINAWEQGSVFIGKNIDVGELLELEDQSDFEKVLAQKSIERFTADEFNNAFAELLKSDLTGLRKIATIWEKIGEDPKYDAFFESLQNNKELKNQRLLVFTESRETAEYLYANLEKAIPGKAMLFSSKNGVHNGKIMSTTEARACIKNNFDPSADEPSSQFHILLTTDILAEGMNLHKAGRIINYDLPWNPTRVMQRLGRINRVGTEHKELFIFNFFPTAQADTHLGLNANINRKITAFNAVLGNDNKILFEDEHPDPHGLLGRLTKLVEEESEDSELQYLQVIRQIRDNNPKLFEKIKKLPLKARSAYANGDCPDTTIFFFREGYLKKFVAVGQAARELTFLEAAQLFQVSEHEKRTKLPSNYYDRLKLARAHLEDDEVETNISARVTPQVRKVLEIISGLQRLSALSESELDYLKLLFDAVEQSAIGKKTIQALSAVCKRSYSSPIALFNALQAVLPPTVLENPGLPASPAKPKKPRLIVLAQHLAPCNGASV